MAGLSQAEYIDKARRALGSEYNIQNCVPYFNENGQLCIIGAIYSLAGADFYYHKINLENFATFNRRDFYVYRTDYDDRRDGTDWLFGNIDGSAGCSIWKEQKEDHPKGIWRDRGKRQLMIRDVAYFSECGARDVNQDAIYVSARENRGIFVVADGMGGHSGGEIASGVIVNGIQNWWDSNVFTDTEAGIDFICEQCNQLLININAEVFSYFSAKGQMGGAAAAILIIWDGRYMILSSGDSRIYRVSENTLEQLTMDDVWENLPEVKYGMSHERIMCDSRLGRLTEALGSEEQLKISRVSGMLKEREVFFLCSDGVYKYCTHSELENIMCRRMFFKNANRMKNMIKQCAVKNGVDDNYSAIICYVKK